LAAAYRLTSGRSCSRARWVAIIFRTAALIRPATRRARREPAADRGDVARIAQVLGQVAGQLSTAAVTVCGVQMISSIGPS